KRKHRRDAETAGQDLVNENGILSARCKPTKMICPSKGITGVEPQRVITRNRRDGVVEWIRYIAGDDIDSRDRTVVRPPNCSCNRRRAAVEIRLGIKRRDSCNVVFG